MKNCGKMFEGLVVQYLNWDTMTIMREVRNEEVRASLLGAFIDSLTLEQCVEKISFFIDKSKQSYVITLNPEMLYRAQLDREMLGIINRADLVTADGVGIVWASRIAGQPVPERVTGIDLVMRLLDSAVVKGWRVFFLGSAPGVAESAAQKAVDLFPGLCVAGTYHGYFSEEDNNEVVSKIISVSPQLLLVAMGSPRQERWIFNNIGSFDGVVAIGVGGSLDVLSGNVRRVPESLRKLNLEWLGRLFQEPRRWKRMTVLPRFAFLVFMKYKIGKILRLR